MVALQFLFFVVAMTAATNVGTDQSRGLFCRCWRSRRQSEDPKLSAIVPISDLSSLDSTDDFASGSRATPIEAAKARSIARSIAPIVAPPSSPRVDPDSPEKPSPEHGVAVNGRPTVPDRPPETKTAAVEENVKTSVQVRVPDEDGNKSPGQKTVPSAPECVIASVDALPTASADAAAAYLEAQRYQAPLNDCIESQLGPQVEPYIGRKTLVLDLDETLIHSCFRHVPNPDITITVEIDEHHHKVSVRKRPGVDEFLAQVAQLYEVVVYTASKAKYANPLLDQLDKNGVVASRLFREACTRHTGGYVKDLSRLGRELKHVIIIDNSPLCYALQPQNAIPIKTWRDDMSDNELLELIPILQSLAEVDNIPLLLNEIVWTNDVESEDEAEAAAAGASNASGGASPARGGSSPARSKSRERADSGDREKKRSSSGGSSSTRREQTESSGEKVKRGRGRSNSK